MLGGRQTEREFANEIKGATSVKKRAMLGDLLAIRNRYFAATHAARTEARVALQAWRANVRGGA